MLDRDVPIDGVGLQMHVGALDSEPSASDFSDNVARLAALGLEVVVSEIDVQVCGAGDSSAERLERQRVRYRDLVRVCTSHRACTAISVWGVTDRHSWLNARRHKLACRDGVLPAGLLFDEHGLRKPAHAGVIEGLLRS
jgi:endo-1,4-beta-xylanase